MTESIVLTIARWGIRQWVRYRKLVLLKQKLVISDERFSVSLNGFIYNKFAVLFVILFWKLCFEIWLRWGMLYMPLKSVLSNLLYAIVERIWQTRIDFGKIKSCWGDCVAKVGFRFFLYYFWTGTFGFRFCKITLRIGN